MFGESESESPRTGSPWDGLLSMSDPASPAVEPARSPRVVPKLVPELEEGNVEYKLRLLNPSTERFTRLVTQLKWRLLEGGGQAYYELGVADSGQLVGLSRTHLEQSLQTLEEMAGEIGASVIVVKEIELPPALVEAVKNSGGSGKVADGATRMHKVRVADYVETPPSSVGMDEESVLSVNEIDEDTCCGLSPAHLSVGVFAQRRQDSACSHQLTTVDEAYDSPAGDDTAADLDFEIASVYKPRPHRRRTPTPHPTPPKMMRTLSDDMFSLDLTSLHVPSAPVDVPKQRYPMLKTGRSKEKDLRRSLHAQIPRLVLDSGDGINGDADSEPASASPSGIDAIGTGGHLRALDELEVAAAMFNFNNTDEHQSISFSDSQDSSYSEAAISRSINGSAHVCSDVMHNGILTPDDPNERRYIVEALVVRKMSLEEVFLDFVNI